MRGKRDSIKDDDVRAVLAAGAVRAKEVSKQTLEAVRQAVGITL